MTQPPLAQSAEAATALFATLFHASPVAISISTLAEGRILDANDQFLATIGYQREEVLGRTVLELGIWADAAERARMVELMRTQGCVRGLELSFRSRSGQVRRAVAAYDPIELDGQACLLGIFYDITEAKRAEAALRASEARFRLLFESIPLPVLVYHESSLRFVDVNDVACRHYGYPRDQFLALTLDDLQSPADRLAPAPEPAPGAPSLWRHRRHDGTLIDVEVTAYALTLDEQPARIAVVRDVTEQRRIEAELRRSEERFELVARSTTDAVYEWNVASGQTRWNHGMRTLFGYPVDAEQAHQWWREQVHPEDREATVASVEAALRNRDQFWQAEYRYRRADGSYAHVLDRGYILYDADQRPVRMVGAMIDITERVQLAQAQAQAALEERQRLARELHDSVTQSLYSLTLLAEAGRRLAAAGDVERVGQYVGRLGETAQQALKEMRLLVYQLRPLALETEGLAGALQHRLDAVEKRAGVQARLVVEGLIDLPAPVEEGLFRVAQEALNNSLKHSGATSVTVTLCLGGGWAGLEVADNGSGFDPAADTGGLGLTSMRERVDKLGGRLDILTEPGAGTRVRASVRTEATA